MLETDLRGAEDVAGGVERDDDVANRGLSSPRQVFDDRVGQTPSQQWRALLRTQVGARSGTRVVTVRMGDDRLVDGQPRVDVEPAGFAVQPVTAVGDHLL